MLLPAPRKSAYRARKDGSYPWLQSGLRMCASAAELDDFWIKYQGLIEKLPKGWQQTLEEEKERLAQAF